MPCLAGFSAKLSGWKNIGDFGVAGVPGSLRCYIYPP